MKKTHRTITRYARMLEHWYGTIAWLVIAKVPTEI